MPTSAAFSEESLRTVAPLRFELQDALLLVDVIDDFQYEDGHGVVDAAVYAVIRTRSRG